MTTGVFAYKDKQKEYILANLLKPTFFFFFTTTPCHWQDYRKLTIQVLLDVI